MMLIGGANAVISDWVWDGALNALDADAQRLAVLRVALDIELQRQGLTIEQLIGVVE
jgi:hypothetical protein